ncbi:hypothetical protein CLV51_107216 [Chitinophaga niastensis]|uniref:Uncharacterized protein n=1 Tax=Chitinophaga niastensis TaxID=536980 RepID=A0A2P8HCF7_CHINA|nr:alpha/beta hydrolase-fold protein [Chitinophaga niastensis]PSL43904.1 hypothetical protein CLV51_107216 [Chitinophaga niastensis]
MNKHILLAFFLSLPFLANAQSPKNLVSFGQADSVTSDILKEQRPLWVYSPPVDTSIFAKPAYPVLYVLDGDAHFASLMTMIFQLSVINGNTALPQMIIVGIPNTSRNRSRDLTPFSNASDKTSGGGEKFTAFLEKELIPYIDNHYATAPYRIFIGHSLGGLLVANTLISHPGIFNAYVAIDPSLWWDNSHLLKEADHQLQQNNYKGKSFFLAIAHTMNPALDTVQIRKDTALGSIHTTAILQLSEQLKKYSGNNLRWKSKYYEDDDHNSIPLIAAYDALRFIFHNNRFPTYLYFDKNGSPDSLKKLIIAHYQQLSREMGYTVRPSEIAFNQFGYMHLQQNNFDKAQMFFQLNIDYFPESFNTYDSMGDYYIARNDQAKAIAYWEKALAIKYVISTKEKLDKTIAQKK